MSKSFDISFSLSMRATLSDETIQTMRASLCEAVELVEKNPERATSTQRASARYISSLLQLEDDEFLSAFLKHAMRSGAREEIAKVFTKDQALGVTRVSPLDVKITPRLPKADGRST